jgi:hypothetical protein
MKNDSASRILRASNGTVEFRYDDARDIVIARPRWTLATVSDVSRWYQMSLAYFMARYRGRKDVVVHNDDFDVVPRLSTLWGQYRALLHDSRMSRCVTVGTSARVQMATNASSVQHGVHTFERATVEDAIELIVSMRKSELSPRDESAPVSGDPPASSRHSKRPPSMRPPKKDR